MNGSHASFLPSLTSKPLEQFHGLEKEIGKFPSVCKNFKLKQLSHL